MNTFTIKDLENLSGVKAHTIRIWEQRYSFLKPQRTQTNIRYYSNDELKTILNISLLNKYGYKISHIDKMPPTEIREKLMSLGLAEAQQERIVNELLKAMVDMDVDNFDAVLTAYVSSRGIDKTINQIIFPFLEKVGMLWLSNHINPAQEHLVSNIIRQKLVVGIEHLSTHLVSDRKVILFLPEGEYHEISLLYLHYMFKSRGIRVLYLGANVPLKDLEFVVKIKKPDFLFTHLTSVAHNFNFERFLTNLYARIPNVPLLVSGAMVAGYRKALPPNVHFKHSLAQVNEYLASLA